MCGRYQPSSSAAEIARWFKTIGPLPNTQPRYNAAPTDSHPVVLRDRESRRSSSSGGEAFRFGRYAGFNLRLLFSPRTQGLQGRRVPHDPAGRVPGSHRAQQFDPVLPVPSDPRGTAGARPIAPISRWPIHRQWVGAALIDERGLALVAALV